MKTINLYVMTSKGFNVLKSILKHKALINHVVIGRDENLVDDCSIEIKKLCDKNLISNSWYNEKINIKKADYSIAISWRWLIKDSNSKLIVIHDSLLPRLRGFAPLVTSLINEDKKIGATALFASDNYDKGDVITQISKEIKYPIKIKEAIEIITNIYIELVDFILNELNENKELITIPQNEKEATYSIWRDEEDYLIDWNWDAEKIKRKIDALGFPYKGAASYINKEIYRIMEAEVVEDVKIENRDCGKVIFNSENKPVIICGKGLIKLEIVKNEKGENVLPFSNFRIRFK